MNNTVNEIELRDNKTLHSTVEYTFFSNACEMFTKLQHVLVFFAHSKLHSIRKDSILVIFMTSMVLNQTLKRDIWNLPVYLEIK